jgi:hypothetical protein
MKLSNDAGLLTLSPCGRGRAPARGAGRARGQVFEDSRANASGIFCYLVVPEADDAETPALEMPRSPLIPGEINDVLSPIDLDDQAMRKANEIDNVLIDQLLAAELVAG